jgi:hypothetical protein
VAYWLLTGELVFTPTPISCSWRRLYATETNIVEKPRFGTSALDALVLSCLAKERKERPQSARDLLKRLDAIPLPQRWTDTRAREWWDEHLPATSDSDR